MIVNFTNGELLVTPQIVDGVLSLHFRLTNGAMQMQTNLSRNEIVLLHKELELMMEQIRLVEAEENEHDR